MTTGKKNVRHFVIWRAMNIHSRQTEKIKKKTQILWLKWKIISRRSIRTVHRISTYKYIHKLVIFVGLHTDNTATSEWIMKVKYLTFLIIHTKLIGNTKENNKADIDVAEQRSIKELQYAVFFNDLLAGL